MRERERERIDARVSAVERFSKKNATHPLSSGFACEESRSFVFSLVAGEERGWCSSWYSSKLNSVRCSGWIDTGVALLYVVLRTGCSQQLRHLINAPCPMYCLPKATHSVRKAHSRNRSPCGTVVREPPTLSTALDPRQGFVLRADPTIAVDFPNVRRWTSGVTFIEISTNVKRGEAFELLINEDYETQQPGSGDTTTWPGCNSTGIHQTLLRKSARWQVFRWAW